MKSIRRFALALVCCMALVAGSAFLAGCAEEKPLESPTSMKVETPSGPAAAQDDAVHPTIGAGDTTVQVTNETGSDIVGLRIKPATQESYGAENSFDGFVFANGETVYLSFDKVSDVTDYDVVLLTGEDGKIAVRNIKLAESENLAFHFEDGVGYVSYTDASTGQIVDNRTEALDAEADAPVVSEDLETQQG